MNKNYLKLSDFIEELYDQLASFSTMAVKCELTFADIDFDLDEIETRYGKHIFLIPPIINRREAHEKVEFEIDISYMRGVKFKVKNC